MDADFGRVVGPPGQDGAPGAKGDKGDPATINGENVLTIEAGENVTIAQDEGTLTISADGAITGATVNGTDATVTGKKIILSVPTQTSDLNNDSGYQTAAQVDASISARVATLYKPGGSATLSTLPPLTAASLGYVYDMTEAFTTTADFKEGVGNAYPAGTNVAIVDVGSGAYKYDALSGFVDLSGKQDKLAVTGAANKGVYVSAAGVVSAMTYSLDADVPANFAPATAAPLMDGAAAVGVSVKYAREDHRHPTDTSRASAVDVAKILDYLSAMEVYRTASGNPATFSDGKAANLKALSVTIAPTQSGSGDPSPSNVRPISGVSSVTVTRSGENLLELDASYNDGSISYVQKDAETNTVAGNVTTDGGKFLARLIAHIPAAGNYVISFDAVAFVAGLYIYNDNLFGSVYHTINPLGNAKSFPLTFDRPGNFVVGVYVSGNNGKTASVSRIQLNAGAQALPFVPSRVSSVAVPLSDGSDPLTVYGGTLDVTTGMLTVTYKYFHRAVADMNNEEFFPGWKSTGARACIPVNHDDLLNGAVTSIGAKIRGNYAYNLLFFTVGDYGMRQSQWKELYPDLEMDIALPLLNPITYTLTPAQLAALAGYNSVSADAGTLSVTYLSDPSIALGGD